MPPLNFINQDQSNRHPSERDQKTIRQVSRRAGAAARQRRAAPKINTLQMPDFLVHGIGPSPNLVPQLSILANGRQVPTDICIVLQPDFIQSLLHHAAVKSCDADPRRWVKVCRLANDSLMRLLPQVYGYDQCLDTCIDCLLLQFRQAFMPEAGDSSDTGELQLARAYNRAIQGLANSVYRTVEWTGWFATLLMALFELLDSQPHDGWIMHSAGALAVLEALGPHSITTEAQKDILIAQVELVIMEMFYRNLTADLDQPNWQQAMQATIISTSGFDDRSKASITWLMISASAPRLFKRATDIIMCRSLEAKKEVLRALHHLSDRYEEWHFVWRADLSIPANLASNEQHENDGLFSKRVGALSRYLSYLSLTQRFIFALAPCSNIEAEFEASRAANLVVNLSGSLPVESLSHLRIRNAWKIADSIQRTTLQFQNAARGREGLDRSDYSDNAATIGLELFVLWSSVLSRSTD